MGRRLKLWVALGLVASAMTVGTVAAAVLPDQHTDTVTATFAGIRAAVIHESTCTGDDGQYRQAIETYPGPVTGDPRLTGIGTLILASLRNTTTGNGTTLGTLVVLDPTTQQVRFRAVVEGVITGTTATNIKGVITGVVQDRGGQQGGRLVANFQAVGAGTSLYLGIGGGGTTAMPAVIQSGACPLAPPAS